MVRRSAIAPLFFFFIALFPLSIGGQPQTASRATRISIQVKDVHGDALGGASKVTLVRGDGMVIEETNTDLEGRTQFEGFPRTDLVITVRHDGYLPATERLNVHQLALDQSLSIVLTKSATLREVGGPSRVRADYLASPPKARREYEKGIEQASKGNYARSAAHLEKAVALYAEFPTAWNDLGREYLRLQKYDQAQTAFRKAIDLDDKFAAPLFNLGWLCNAQKRFGEAEPLLVHLMNLEQRWDGFFELGNTHYGLMQYAKAEGDYKKAMELNPHIPGEIHVKLGNTYASSRQFAKAFDEFKTYLQQDPQGPMAAQVRRVMQKMQADGVVGSNPQ